MRFFMTLGFAVLLMLVFLWGRNLQAPTHVRDTAYDLLLSTLLSHRVSEVSVDQLASGGGQILDARSYREFAVSHIQGATWVGYEDFAMDRLVRIEKQAPVAVYCSVGYRSERIVERLQRQGYAHVVNVYGGIFEWVNRNHPLVTEGGAGMEAIHAYSRFWGVWLNRGARIDD